MLFRSVAADLASQGFSASQIADALGTGATPLVDYNTAQELAAQQTGQFAPQASSLSDLYQGGAQVPTSFETDYGGFTSTQPYNAPGMGGMGTTSPIDGMRYQEAAATAPSTTTPLSSMQYGNNALADSGQTVEQMNAANAAAQPSWLSSLRQQAKQFGGQEIGRAHV